jgi:hypothetical protein
MPWKPTVSVNIKQPIPKGQPNPSEIDDPVIKIKLKGKTRVIRKSQLERVSKRARALVTNRDESVRTYFKQFKPITLEHINVEGEEPLTFNREQDLKDYCKKHELESGALL